MLEYIVFSLDWIENSLWQFAAPLLLLLGFYLTFSSRFVQIRKLPFIFRSFGNLLFRSTENSRGIHPLKAFFACVGGCVGVGNIVAISTAIQLGGPGALFWIWITAFVGMMVKYAEVFLGVKYRVPDSEGGYTGGPIYFLPKAFSWKALPTIAAILLCLYGVEVYQFRVVIESLSLNWHLNYYAVMVVFLMLIVFAGYGGIRRVGQISSILIPFFVVCYLGMGLWVLIQNLSLLPALLAEVVTHAFRDSAPLGGFVGSSLMLTISHGVKRGCYTGDLGVGYASVIHSESQLKKPQEQAQLAFMEIFLDTFAICTSSIFLILLTGVWNQPISAEMMVQTALSLYFPYMEWFIPLLFFLLGYSTINAYFCVGLKCAKFLAPKYGYLLYFAYATIALILFSFVRTEEAQSVMTIVGGLLLLMNCAAIFRLRNELSYSLEEQEIPIRPIQTRLAD